jgi:hypothetical protein
MAVKKTPLQSYLDTKAKLEALQLSMSQAVDDIKSSIYKDMEELTSGASPDGKERKNWLARLGHPYGRKSNDDYEGNKNFNRQRGASRYKRGKDKGKRKGSAPLLPIGRISGGLQSSKYVLKDRQGTSRWILSAGFNKKAKGAVYVLLPEGTNKMVARGIWGKSKNGAESGELGKRIKQYRKAFRDMYQAKNKKGTK